MPYKSTTKLPPIHVYDILRYSLDSGDAFRKLFQWRKSHDKTLSLSKMCRTLGITSKGYLSDVASGRRKLALRYLAKVATIFGLEGHADRYFQLLVRIDHEENDKARLRMQAELRSILKAMVIREEALPMAIPTSGTIFEVFCAFGLFKGRASLRELLHTFPESQVSEIEGALRLLEKHRYIVKKSDRYQLICDEVRFLPTGDCSGNIVLIRDAMQRSSQSLDRHFSDADSSFYESLVVSTKKAVFKKQLGKIKSQFRQTSSDLESHDADMLVRLNIQVHPIP